MLIAVAQLFGNNVIRAPLRVFIEMIRSTPFLVQLFLVYYGGPSFGLSLDPIPAGILGLGIYGSVYFAEIFRSGFESVARGQLEAADCLGISKIQCIVRIQIPQMLVIILPALVNMVSVLCKETAVLSIITIPELTMVLTSRPCWCCASVIWCWWKCARGWVCFSKCEWVASCRNNRDEHSLASHSRQ
jgi:polar amino acid transport system permease protein